MHTWTERLPRPLERWHRLEPQRRRELRLAAADWLYALGPLLVGLQFQVQSIDGWGLAGGAVGALFEEQSARYGSALPGLLYFVLPVLCAAAATLVRRTRPLWLTSVALVLLLGFANPVPAMVAVYSYASHSGRALYPLLWGLSYAASMMVVYRTEGGGLAVTAVMALLSLLVLGFYVGTRSQLVDSLQERAERLERERHLLAERAVGAERTRIAREMHDVVAHRVGFIVLHAGGLEVSSTDPRAVETAELIRTAGRQALGELRDILGVLRDRPADLPTPLTRPTLDGVGELVAEWKGAGMRVELLDPLPGEGIPLAVQATAFHIVREGLTNAAKHATGAQVEVGIRHGAGALRIEVTNGPPPALAEPAPSSGFGLPGLRERVAAVGGELVAQARPRGGWRLSAELATGEDAA